MVLIVAQAADRADGGSKLAHIPHCLASPTTTTPRTPSRRPHPHTRWPFLSTSARTPPPPPRPRAHGRCTLEGVVARPREQRLVVARKQDGRDWPAGLVPSRFLCDTRYPPPPPAGIPHARPGRAVESALLLPGGTGAQPLARGPHHRRSLMRAVGGPDLDGAIVDAYGARSARRPAVGARQGDDESWPLHKTNATKPYRRPPAFRHAKTRPSACSCAGPAASTWRRARSFAFERCQHPID